jgi:rhodanese-related sulfurtransferase
VKITVAFFSILTFLAAGCQSQTAQPAADGAVSYIHASAAEFEKLLESDSTAILLDVRTREEFAVSQIDGAMNIDIKKPDFLAIVKQLDKSKTYLVYCRSGKRSVDACERMSAEGFACLVNLRGGILEWQRYQAPQ